MIATFLVAGLGSPRDSERPLRDVLAEHGVGESVVTAPDLSNTEENAQRRRLLTTWYGWGRYESLFGGLATADIVWWNGAISRDALVEVEVIRWLCDEHPGAFPGRKVGLIHEHNRARWRGGDSVPTIARAIARGAAIPPPIVITTPTLDRVVILDGHTRVCALASLGAHAPAEVPVIAGVTSRAAEWSEW